ncbi:hrp65 protein-like isoform X2 [Macrosteles quadrilineatus]|uniref:hrp65 protein-like isoform X2 n=1 Tax=Macrosteles quadrilineatus TaxID=74068 RepID=UPI0023E0E858|nr:hrp65 protein-like isoform X2 [Macrosteles quadrilineatus]
MSNNAVKTEVKPEKRETNGPENSHPQNQHQQHGGRGGGGGPRGGFRGGRGGPGGRPGPNRFQGSPGGRGRPDNNQGEHMEQDGEGGHGPAGRGGGNFRGRGRGGFRGGDDRGPRSQDQFFQDRLTDKLLGIGGPTNDLPPSSNVEKKFAGRARLYIGNVTNDITDDDLNGLFASYGETNELFVNREKNFAFIRMDYRSNAEKAKRELDGSMHKGRVLKVRFAPLGASVKVKNLTPWVSNELLEMAFAVFGEVERAVVIVDERGNSKREGIVEFARKNSALAALRKCAEGCYFLTSSLRPVVLEPFEPNDDVDGYPEKNLPKKSADYYKAREVGPRMANPGSFEYEYGTRWKQLHELYKQKEEALLREMKLDEEKLEAQMEYARYEQETELLREQLRQRELDRERQKREWEMKERQAEEQRRADEELMRRQSEEMSIRMLHQEDELRRRQQENNLFMQEQRAPTGYDSGAQGSDPREYETHGGAAALPTDPKTFMDSYERGGRGFEGGRDMRPMDDAARGRPDAAGPRSRWGQAGERRPQPQDDYPNKRRRF